MLELTSTYLPAMLKVASTCISFISLLAGIAVPIYAVLSPASAFIKSDKNRVGVLIRSVLCLAIWLPISYVMANAFLVGLFLGGWESSPRDQGSGDKGQLILVVSGGVYILLGAVLAFWMKWSAKHTSTLATENGA